MQFDMIITIWRKRLDNTINLILVPGIENRDTNFWGFFPSIFLAFQISIEKAFKLSLMSGIIEIRPLLLIMNT